MHSLRLLFFRAQSFSPKKFHSSIKISYFSSKTNISSLAKLRKHTGLPLSSCREALNKNDDDFDKALEWIRKESIKKGWAKIGKYSNNTLTQGVLGLAATNSHAVIVEVNCETDFVARNPDFQILVEKAGECILKNFMVSIWILKNPFVNNSSYPCRAKWDMHTLSKLNLDNTHSLADMVALTLNKIGESIAINRAVGLSVGSNVAAESLAAYAHQSSSGLSSRKGRVDFGKYASIVRYQAMSGDLPENWKGKAALVGRQICQHIIGLNPLPGLLSSVPVGLSNEANLSTRPPDEDSHLLEQPFIFDESLTVREVATLNRMHLLDFVRWEVATDEIGSEGDERDEQVNTQASSSSNASGENFTTAIK
ncbi:unnamed protein product [Protopolystoma xenopodis]|uniref:Elongation factor Ts, mitochondrial n=1 Tax=Protopolystoma xenopodis TaxID=117903 RepID=A0A3S5B1W4_9PLAT|nr:unnamed protein product [Protopolystoma xenopodis]